MTQKQLIGAWGEQQASLFLSRNGYSLVVRNFFTRYGEIDIVAIAPDTALCFIEVKTRTGHIGSAERAVNRYKQERMQLAAISYCQMQRIDATSQMIRFEQISMYVSRKDKKITIKKYELPPLDELATGVTRNSSMY